ncbi:hypothetical protein V6Z12_D05G309400 [Gossypium hirsutum]
MLKRKTRFESLKHSVILKLNSRSRIKEIGFGSGKTKVVE